MSIVDRTLDAVVLDVEATAHVEQRALRRRVERLLSAGVDVALVTGRPLADLNGLAVPWPEGPGRLLTQEAGDGAGYRAVLDDLAAGGMRAEAVALVVGDVAGTSAAVDGRGHVLAATACDLLDLLDHQLWRRAALRLPPSDASTDQASWVLVEPVPPGAGSSPRDALFTVGDGAFGTRGGLEEVPDAATVLASGAWAGEGTGQHLLAGPQWAGLRLAGTALGGRRLLDLRSGMLLRDDGVDERADDGPGPGPGPGQLRTARFASATRLGLHVLRAEGPAERFEAGPALHLPRVPGEPGASCAIEQDAGRTGPVAWARVRGTGGWLVAAAVQTQVDHRGRRTVVRLAVHRVGPDRDAALADAVDAVRDAQLAGYERLLAEHRRAWSQRWAEADVSIPGDPDAQLALRFALFQLRVNAGSARDGSHGDELAVGARGLSGPGYAGHVFWDTDVFVLPALATVCPASARAMLQYRINRLPAARARADRDGRAGARFPWESARDGGEVTPPSTTLGDEVIPVLTGEQEEHITADVAWAADRYATWTGDTALLAGPGRPLVVETARYWASRVESGDDGRGHVRGVIGADEYHEGVDDDVFTNVMARWNLLRAADLVEPDAGAPGETGDAAGEARRWRELAASLADGYDPRARHHEQFTGYLALEPLTSADVAPVPFAADLLLGRERVHATQLVKQPDVLMAHFLVPECLAPESLPQDIELYAPRTTHGSSLSPAITAAALARAGRPDEGLATFRIALRLDLDDLTGSGAKGLHLATLGGVWQTVLAGFLGLQVRDGVLSVDPQLPTAWPTVTATLQVLGARVQVTADAATVTVVTDRPVRVTARGHRPVRITGEIVFDRDR